MRTEDRAEPGVVDITETNASVWDAAGSMISTARDLAVFIAALLAGELVPPPLDQMPEPFPRRIEAVPSFLGFGLGVQRLRMPDQCGGGHAVYGRALSWSPPSVTRMDVASAARMIRSHRRSEATGQHG